MAKKTKEVPEEVEKVIEKSVEKVLAPIATIHVEFGREDLNLLRDKLNEVIQRLG